MAALAARRGDVRRRRLVAGKIFGDGFAVVAHVRVVEVAEQAHGAGTMRDQLPAGLEFEIFRARTGDVGVQEDAVGHLRHQGFGEAGGTPVVVVFDHHAIGISACIGGIVVRAVVVHGPVQEL